jgi:cytochrome c553
VSGRGPARVAAAALSVALPLLLSHSALSEAADPQLCSACHGPDGNSPNPAIPSIAGQPGQFISMQLYQFREGNRKDPQMTPIAANLSNADMNQFAAYFSAQKATPAVHKTTPDNAATGPVIAQKFNCVQCHGPALLGQQHIPRIAGQQFEYLRTQLRGFKAQTRADIDGNMSAAAQGLSDKDVEILSDYVAGLPPH